MDLLSDLTPQQVLSDPESLESYELDAPSASHFRRQGRSVHGVCHLRQGHHRRHQPLCHDERRCLHHLHLCRHPLSGPADAHLRYDDSPELPELRNPPSPAFPIQGPGEDAQPLLLAASIPTTAPPPGSAGERMSRTMPPCRPCWRIWRRCRLPGVWTTVLRTRRPPSADLTPRMPWSRSPILRRTAVSPSGPWTVGTTEPGRHGRYARIGADTTIYLLETALLDPLMRIAAGGLTS